jgi:hypothetical protein
MWSGTSNVENKVFKTKKVKNDKLEEEDCADIVNTCIQNIQTEINCTTVHFKKRVFTLHVSRQDCLSHFSRNDGRKVFVFV